METETSASNSNPIQFLRGLAQGHRPRMAVPDAGDRDAYLAWTGAVREKVADLLGLGQMIPAPAVITGFRQTVEDGLRRERFFLQTEPGYFAPVLVNIPEGQGPFAAVLCLHGHVTNGKDGVSGLLAQIPGRDPGELLAEKEHYNDTYAIDLARRGYLTVSLDNRDFNQAANPEPYTYNDYGWHVAHIAWLNALGRSYAGCAVWDALRVLDTLEKRADVDPGRLGCTGFSLGGLLTLYLTLVEPRIRAAVVSGYFDSFLGRIARGRGADCLCNYIPGLFAWLDIPDVAAALAPRPLLINVEGQGDLPTFEPVRRAYRALGAGDCVELFQYDAPYHRFSGERAYPWLETWLPPELETASRGD